MIENLGLLGDRTTTNVGVFASSFEMVGNTIVVVPSQTLGLEDEPKRRLDEEGKVIGVEICAAKYFALIRGDHLRLRERVEGSAQEMYEQSCVVWFLLVLMNMGLCVVFYVGFLL